jgi:hypothetical protein
MIVRSLPTLLLFVLIVGCGVGLGPAHARDDGRFRNIDPEIKAWVKGLTDKHGEGCCDTADGYPAEVEWDNDTGKYRVRLDGQWYDVPDDAVIEQPNRLGYAVVWWYQTHNGHQLVPKIKCFLPGAGG